MSGNLRVQALARVSLGHVSRGPVTSAGERARRAGDVLEAIDAVLRGDHFVDISGDHRAGWISTRTARTSSPACVVAERR